MLITLNRQAWKAFWFMWASEKAIKLKRDTREIKASILKKVEPIKIPAKARNLQTGKMFDLDETGSGCNDWGWPDTATVDFTKDEGRIMKAMNDATLDGEGYPNDIATGVDDLTKMLEGLTAEEKKETKT